jgi:hypothetical protein
MPIERPCDRSFVTTQWRPIVMKPIHPNEAFFQALRQIDQDLFLAAKEKGCPHCGGSLDTANYQRKTKGMTEGENELCFSLCCRREGCRKRKKPRSLRFLGRRVFGAWVVILAVDFCLELGLKGSIHATTSGCAASRGGYHEHSCLRPRILWIPCWGFVDASS